jgi:hypothetical protein
VRQLGAMLTTGRRHGLGILVMAAMIGCKPIAVTEPPRLETIAAGPDDRRHLPYGTDHDYGTPFPIFGPHSPRPTETGFYERPQPAVELVHALEHGNVVIYYDIADAEVLAKLRRLTEDHPGSWDGVVVVPSPRLGSRIVLTAWENRMTLSRFDETAIAEFLDRFRGRGPEHPVR